MANEIFVLQEPQLSLLQCALSRHETQYRPVVCIPWATLIAYLPVLPENALVAELEITLLTHEGIGFRSNISMISRSRMSSRTQVPNYPTDAWVFSL